MRPLRFRILALIAAYALAIHGLVSAFAVIIPTDAAAHVAGLCLNADQNNAPAGNHDASCALACAVVGDKLAAPAPPIVAVVEPVVALVLDPVDRQASPRPVAKGPQRARAPPLV